MKLYIMSKNPSSLKNKVLGCIVGGILGDALGSHLEFKTAQEIIELYPQLENVSDITWIKRANYTDDSCQMIEIINSLLENHAVNIDDIGERFYQWMVHDGRGIGGLTRQVLKVYGKKKENIIQVSKAVWESRGKNACGNGGVMRTSPIGIFFHNDKTALIDAADAVCKITHYDPRCRDSCIALCLGIAQLLHGTLDYDAIANDLSKGMMKDIIKNLATDSIEKLSIDGQDMGFTLHTTRLAFLALYYARSYSEGLLSVFRKGGDVDTNGIVAGSLLGAKYGLDGIPSEWLKEFRFTSEIMDIAEKFYAIIPK